MQELKIRAKKMRRDSGDKVPEWLYSSGYYFDGVNYWFPLRGESDASGNFPVAGIQWVIVDPATICRFVGKRDINGVDIYQGDIVVGKAVDPELPGFEEVEFTAVVCWSSVDARFYLVVDDGLASVGFEYAPAQTAEVIGNIIDGPK